MIKEKKFFDKFFTSKMLFWTFRKQLKTMLPKEYTSSVKKKTPFLFLPYCKKWYACNLNGRLKTSFTVAVETGSHVSLKMYKGMVKESPALTQILLFYSSFLFHFHSLKDIQCKMCSHSFNVKAQSILKGWQEMAEI